MITAGCVYRHTESDIDILVDEITYEGLEHYQILGRLIQDGESPRESEQLEFAISKESLIALDWTLRC